MERFDCIRHERGPLGKHKNGGALQKFGAKVPYRGCCLKCCPPARGSNFKTLTDTDNEEYEVQQNNNLVYAGKQVYKTNKIRVYINQRCNTCSFWHFNNYNTLKSCYKQHLDSHFNQTIESRRSVLRKHTF